ncbi:MAG: amidohydrolase [SAR202 cluster bacterium]|mgnify:FL=1|nr:amidohydrolase [SAR202 cluster bacterium]|tara:strand:+ start:2468 stop:3310 length:843 start_codon:yes stop_codon:yes gene_type:complete
MKAIDIHAHIPRMPGLSEYGIEPGLRQMFRMADESISIEKMVETYRAIDTKAVIFSVDAETETGDLPDPNDYVAQAVDSYPDVFIGFCSVDPRKGKAAVEELERSVLSLGLRGLKLHPIHQAFFPDDPAFIPLFAKAEELGIPVLMHSGYAAAGANAPGGGGFELAYSRPIPHVDSLAARHPDLTIIMAHPAWPWIQEQVAVALHKSNVFIDLSGWAPRYIPKELISEAGGRLRKKVLFGSDYPYISPVTWLEQFQELDIRDESRPLILHDNAARILNLA